MAGVNLGKSAAVAAPHNHAILAIVSRYGVLLSDCSACWAMHTCGHWKHDCAQWRKRIENIDNLRNSMQGVEQAAGSAVIAATAGFFSPHCSCYLPVNTARTTASHAAGRSRTAIAQPRFPLSSSHLHLHSSETGNCQVKLQPPSTSVITRIRFK